MESLMYAKNIAKKMYLKLNYKIEAQAAQQAEPSPVAA